MSMQFNFSGKRALVTGASRGIGHKILIALAEAGAEVVGLARNIDPITALVKTNPALKVSGVSCDLKNWTETRTCVESLGDFDLLVNNAGFLATQTFMDTTPEVFDDTFAVNVKATLNVSQVVAKGMIARGGGGAIVNISSVVSTLAGGFLAVYAASKASLDSLTRSQAVELGLHKIRVNSVNPGVILTDMTHPFIPNSDIEQVMREKMALNQRMIEIEDVVPTVLFLLSNDCSAMTTGSVFPIDGGFLVKKL